MSYTIFIDNICELDCAIISDEGKLVGNSFTVSAIGTGQAPQAINIDIIKGVLVGILKNALDGFDHKIWIIPGYSMCEVIQNTVEVIELRADSFHLIAPRESTKIIECNYIGSITETCQRAIKQHLWNKLTEQYPDANPQLEISLKTELIEGAKQVRYVHGIKNSSVSKYQNIHGHCSWMKLTHDELFNPECFDCARGVQAFNEIYAIINNSIIINKEHIVSETETHLTYGYLNDKGKWEITLDKSKAKLLILSDESFTGNILNALIEKHASQFELGHVKSLMFSEGISTGSVKRYSY